MTDGKESQRRSTFPSLYFSIYTMMQEAARETGWCLALHGSMRRDLDVVAIPWIAEAIPAEDLINLLAQKVGFFTDITEYQASDKPHGRRVTRLVLSGGAYVDLSIMPRCP